jgi:hypothetical protein
MYSNERYKSKILQLTDIYDGIIMFLYLILIVSMGICFTNRQVNEIYGILVAIIVVEGIINISKILFCIFFRGSDKDYEEIKMRIMLVPWVMSLPLMGYSIFVLITKINEEFFALCTLLSYNIISLFRIINFFLFVNKNK